MNKETIVKMTFVSDFASNKSRISLPKLLLDIKKEFSESTPRVTAHTKGNSPGPGFERDPVPRRIDSRQIAKDNAARKRVLIESWFFNSYLKKYDRTCTNLRLLLDIIL